MNTCAAILLAVLLSVFGIASVGVMRQGPDVAPAPSAVTAPNGYFTADTTIIPAGGCVTLAWSKPGASSVMLSGSNWPDATTQPVGLTGSTIVCPSAALNYVPNVPVDYILITFYPDGTTTTEIITITYSDFYPPATPTPAAMPPTPLVPSLPATLPPSQASVTPLPIIASVHFQNFERGFMLQLAGADCVYVYATVPAEGILMGDPGTGYQYCTPVAGLPDNPFPAAPPGLLSPSGDFGKIWGYYAWIQDAIGFATAADFYYDGIVPPAESSLGGGPFYLPIVTLPDGRQLYCGSRAATAYTCQLR